MTGPSTLLLKTPDEVLRRGLELVGFGAERQQIVKRDKNLERFSTHYGCKIPIVFAILWEDLQTTSCEEARVNAKSEKEFDYFMMTIYFLCLYPRENELEGKFGCSNNTAKNWINMYLEKLSKLKEEKISWPNKWLPPGVEDEEGAEEAIIIMSVDGVHFKIQEPTHDIHIKDPKYYSHKHHSSGLNYEIAISVWENKVVWTNGPFAAGNNDIKIFNQALRGKMESLNGKLGVADLGYRGGKHVLAIPNSHDSEDVREFKSRVLSRHETFNGKVKNYDCLSGRFRHDLKKHKLCFDSVVLIGQYQMDHGSPLFDV